MKSFLIALQFLTIFPVKIRAGIREKDFGASLLYFPFVGLLIGLALSLSALLFSFLPGLVKAAGILIISIVITGAIHLDGFADTCDGFYGHKPREKILEIMRDSHIGTVGALGIFCILVLKLSLIANLPGKILYKALILMPVFSRFSQVIACYGASYARRQGKAKYFIEYATKRELAVSFLFTLALFYLVLRLKGLILFICLLLPVFLFFRYLKKRIGGMTGDTIGALNEFAETTVLLLIFSLWSL